MEHYIEFKNICKAFSGVQALRNISFRADGGQVCALLGENGAGKSTLLKIMSGALQMDSGAIVIDGENVEFASPRQAIQRGVSLIYQERQLVPSLTVMENVFMDGLPHGALGIVDFKKAARETQKLIDTFGMKINPAQKAGSLSVAGQQMVEIMKAVHRNSFIIAFDEPTAALTENEIKSLFTVIRQLRSEGKIVLYVSHRLEELYEVTDKMVVFKDGEFTAELQTRQTNNDELVKYMVGREIGDIYKTLSRNRDIGGVTLEIRNLTTKYVTDISLTLRAGEILGFAGLVGSGRSELWNAVFGADKVLSGEILLDGVPVKLKSPKTAIGHGIALCPEDRKEQGLVLRQSVRTNITIPIMRKISKYGLVNRKKEKALAVKVTDDFNVKTPSVEKIVMQLSGGNQQKIILGRWMSSGPRILIMDEPTKGIDVGAKSEIYELAYRLAKQNMAIVFISSELTEVINVSDRVAVMRAGRLEAILDREECTEDKVLSYAVVSKD
jgi:ABC-type sugar transport system ATPase subunit